jgi:ParB family transcriptional regulator, chromosome partitioning protein
MTEKKTSGLGRGLAALLDEAARPAASRGEGSQRADRGVREIEVARIQPNPSQPRTHFDEEAIDELAGSIRERGVLQPVLVRPKGESYELVAGERRWRAAQKAGLHNIPAIIRDIDDSAAAEIALIENIQREDLNAIEEAEGYKKLIERHGHTQDGVARLVNKSRSHVANLLRLLELPHSVRQLLLLGNISMGHARAVLTAPDPEQLAREIVEKGYSVRQAEVLARQSKPGIADAISRAPARRDKQAADADIAALERQLGDILGLKVKVATDGSRGTVTLHYSSLDQLDMICQRLSGEQI